MQEVKDAVFQMRSDSSPGLDGFHARFFQKNWHVVQYDIYAMVMKAKAHHNHDAKIVLFVDYIQLQVNNSFKEREEISQLSRFYKKLAGQMDIHVFSLAQLNRQAGDNDKPSITHLRGSGSLEQDADTIFLLTRPHETDDNRPKHILNVIAETTRLAEGNTQECFIDGPTQLVANLTQEQSMEEDDDIIGIL